MANPGLALLGCDVTFTDEVEVLPLLFRNVERNISLARMSQGKEECTQLGGACRNSHVTSHNPQGADGVLCFLCMHIHAGAHRESCSRSPVGSVRADTRNGAVLGHTEVSELSWGNPDHIAAVEPTFDYIVGTDLVRDPPIAYVRSGQQTSKIPVCALRPTTESVVCA